MIFIYAHSTSIRLQYICKFIFNEQLGITHSITTDINGFTEHYGAKINYSDLPVENSFHIQPHSLLFEADVKMQAIDCFAWQQSKVFFRTKGADIPFDIFAAVFYLISRYEEYLPHEIDMYGRYAHENSIAFKNGFLNEPLVNIWILKFAAILHAKYPGLQFQFPSFTFLPTYDIDIAYSFRHKGLLRNAGGFIKNPSMERLAVMMRMKQDPFDSYDFMDDLHNEYQLNPLYFFLVATSGSMYDKNISPYSNAMWRLIKRHAGRYAIGLHPSWRSNKNPTLLKKEKKVLETASNVSITQSRQHYIKYSLPETFENLIAAGIYNDYSMGYGSINGFRASVASSFYWFNLKTESITSLRLHPFCFMDANSFYEQKQNTEQTYSELIHYFDACKRVNGNLITIFHNNFLGTDKQFAGWKEMYREFISQVRQ